MFHFGDTCDHYATGDLTSKYAYVGDGVSLAVGVGRYGGNAIRMTPTSHFPSPTFVSIGVPTSAATAITTMHLKTASLGVEFAFAEIRDGGNDCGHIIFAVNIGGGITAWRVNDNFANPPPLMTGAVAAEVVGSTPGLLHEGTWHTVELAVKPHATAGTIRIRVDGRDGLVLSGINTKGQRAAATYSMWNIGYYGGSAPNPVDIDDPLVYDDVGSGDGFSDFVGTIAGECCTVVGDGSTIQFTPSSGPNWTCVDDPTPDGDATTIQGGSGKTDTYQHSPLVLLDGEILMAQVVITARLSGAGARNLRGVFRVGGTDYPSATDLGLAGNYTMQRALFAKNPATGVAWTPTVINASEIGQKTTP